MLSYYLCDSWPCGYKKSWADVALRVCSNKLHLLAPNVRFDVSSKVTFELNNNHIRVELDSKHVASA